MELVCLNTFIDSSGLCQENIVCCAIFFSLSRGDGNRQNLSSCGNGIKVRNTRVYPRVSGLSLTK
jgi:hypothetical protein